MIAVALLIGGMALPGAFLAKRLVDRLPLHVVIGGGAVMIVNSRPH